MFLAKDVANVHKITFLIVYLYFFKSPISVRWDGWTDALSGVRDYYVEVFRLEPNNDDRLVESKPIEPEYMQTIDHVATEMRVTYKPANPGMYR